MFWVFCLGIAEDVPVLNVIRRCTTVQKTQQHPKAADKSAQDLNLPTALHHKDGRLVVLSVDPVEQHPEVQILLLPELQTIINQLEAQRRSVREGEEVCRSPHLLPLLLGEGGQPRAEPSLHAGRVVSVYEERPSEPAQDVVQGTLALSQAFTAGAAGLDPVRCERHGQLAPLSGSVVAVVEVPCGRMSLEGERTEGGGERCQADGEEGLERWKANMSRSALSAVHSALKGDIIRQTQTQNKKINRMFEW